MALFLVGGPSVAQELEPRAYRAAPVGLNFAVLSYSYSSGNVLVDPTAPVEGLELELSTIAAGYLRTFNFFGRSASAGVFAPYVLGSGSGTINGVESKGTRNAWADARLRMSVNLLGGPALSMSEFVKRPPGKALGVGLILGVPTGQYSSTKVVNFGANRWSFKPEVGYSSIRGRWILEATLGVWLFTTNSDGPNGTTKKQDPIPSLQGHLSYNFNGGVWLALDLNYFTGGRSSIDGKDQRDLQSNSRVGLTLSLPLAKRHSIKLAGHTGAYTRIGADFDIGTVVYQVRF